MPDNDVTEAGLVHKLRLVQVNALVRDAVKALRALSYAEYLKTDHWLDFRDAMLHGKDCRCQHCETTEGLQIHHLTYDYLGRERPSDVLVLCGDCHRTWHENHKERLSTPTTELIWAGRMRRFGPL